MANFLSKDNIHNFLWALIGALILFLCGLIWNWWSGPDEVKIINSDLSKKDTTVTIIRFEPIGMLQYDSVNNTQLESKKPKNKPSYQFNPAIVDSIIKMTLSKQMTNENSIIQSTSTNTQETENIEEIYRHKFNMTTIV